MGVLCVTHLFVIPHIMYTSSFKKVYAIQASVVDIVPSSIIDDGLCLPRENTCGNRNVGIKQEFRNVSQFYALKNKGFTTSF